MFVQVNLLMIVMFVQVNLLVVVMLIQVILLVLATFVKVKPSLSNIRLSKFEPDIQDDAKRFER